MGRILNGGDPTSISYRTHASEYRSARPSSSRSPSISSGLMYAEGAHGHARVGARGGARLVERVGDAEVGHERVPGGGEEDVFRLDVAMDDAARVRVLERRGDLAGDAERFVDRESSLAAEPFAKRLAFDERHGEEHASVGLSGIEEGEDVRVVEPGDGADLGEEAVVADRGVELRVQDLQRDRPVVFQVGREEYDRRPAVSYFAQHCVSVRDRGGKLPRELVRLIAQDAPLPFMSSKVNRRGAGGNVYERPARAPARWWAVSAR